MHLYSIALATTLLWSASIAKPIEFAGSPDKGFLISGAAKQVLWNQQQDQRISTLESDVDRIDEGLKDLKELSSKFALNPRPNPYVDHIQTNGQKDPFQQVRLASAMKNLGQVLHFLGQSVTLARETITLSGAMASQVNSNTDRLEKTVPNMDKTLIGLESELEKKFPGITKPRPVIKPTRVNMSIEKEKQLIDPSRRKINRIHIKLISDNPVRSYVSKRIITVVKLRPKNSLQRESSSQNSRFQ